MSKKESSEKMLYCDGAKDGAFALNNPKHEGVHYIVVDSEADMPSGFRATLDKKKAK